MSYSTVAEWRAHVSTDQALKAVAGTGTAQDTNIQRGLNTGTIKIHAAARKGGATVPFTQAGLGITAAQWAEFEDWLKACEMNLASGAFAGALGETERWAEAREACEKDLAMLEDGSAIPTPAATDVGGNLEYVSTTGTPKVSHRTLSVVDRVTQPWPVTVT